MTQSHIISVNGQRRRVRAEIGTPLLWVLREDLGLTGTKFGCGVGLCGACTVHVDGAAKTACTLTLGAVGEASITTIEGLSPDRSHPVQRAWLEEQTPQCGYCQSGMIMAAAALLRVDPKPTDAAIDKAITNVCRCGTYARVRAALHRAAAA